MTIVSDAAGQPVGTGDESIKLDVNGEEVVYHFEKSDDRERFKLSVRDILTGAGFTPAEDYYLTRDIDNHRFADLNEEIEVEFGERFTAKHQGQTPVS